MAFGRSQPQGQIQNTSTSVEGFRKLYDWTASFDLREIFLCKFIKELLRKITTKFRNALMDQTYERRNNVMPTLEALVE